LEFNLFIIKARFVVFDDFVSYLYLLPILPSGRRNGMALVTPVDSKILPGTAPLENAISTRNLTKQFGDQFAVQDVNINVPQGSIFGYIGPSGSGKTTTIRMLTGVYPPTSGEVTVLGQAPTRFNQSMRARLGYMPQLFVLYPHLTVWENLNFAASLYGVTPFRKKLLMEVLDFVELTEHRRKLARNISGGMQRRLSLAATLIHRPELIFLDEPTAGIDPVLRRKFWGHFQELQNQGRTLFITTQYVNEAAYCDLVGVMANGKLVGVDTPEGLRHRAFGGEVVDLRTSAPLSAAQEMELRHMPFMKGELTQTGERSYRMIVDEASTAMPALMEWIGNQNVSAEAMEEYVPPFDDVFVELVKDGGSENE
jgi:ABC-2 type transport system ATP-binding protein